MNKPNEYDPSEEEATGRLIKTAGRRPEMPEADLASIRNAARVVWEDHYAKRQGGLALRWLLPLAAALAGVMLLAWWNLDRQTITNAPAIAAAFVERLHGSVVATSAGKNQRVALVMGQSLTIGSVVETEESSSESRAALRMVGGQSIRLDVGTRLRLVGPRIVQLDRGAVYLDSQNKGGVTVHTAFGDFAPVGTQFEVRIRSDEEEGVELRVREGRVRLDRQSGSLIVTAGEAVIVPAAGSIVRSLSRADDSSWEWAAAMAPMMDIEGRSLRSFLDWIARENGWEVEFSDSSTASRSETIVLHGSIEEVTPLDALRTVMLSSGFEYALSNGTLTVRPIQGR